MLFRSLTDRDPTGVAVRPTLHGDVLHSRPAVLSYARDGTDNDIVVFYGGNDGTFRAITGGKANANGGKELWSFIPSEMFSKLVRLYDNAPEIVTGNSGKNKTYFLDGNVTFYASDANADGRLRSADGDKVYVYATARRGGRLSVTHGEDLVAHGHVMPGIGLMEPGREKMLIHPCVACP